MRPRNPNDVRWVPRTEAGLKWLFKRLARYHGVDEIEASERLHAIKERWGIPADVHPPMDRTGTVFSPVGYEDPETREELGSLLPPRGFKRRKRNE